MTATFAHSDQEKPATNKSGPKVWVLSVVLAGAFLLCLASLNPDRFGRYHDDTIFVTTAKSLAGGQGYRIISMPSEPAQVKYPPLYPLLLSLVWRLNGQFPENVTPMMLLSTIATVGFLGLSWVYLVNGGYASRWQALLIVALAAVNWRILVLGTTVYSEMLYGALSVGGLTLAEINGKGRRTWLSGIGSGVLMGLAFVTRTSGVVLVIAVVAYYILCKSSWKRFVPVMVGGLFILGWVGWCYAHRADEASQGTAYYASTSYLHDFYAVIGEERALSGSSGLVALASIVAMNFFMLILMSVPMVTLGLDYNWIQGSGGGDFFLLRFGLIVFAFIFLGRGFIRHRASTFRLLHVYVLSYLALHVFWPYTSYDRFLMPLLPFLLLFAIAEVTVLITPLRKNLTSRKVATVISAAFIGLLLIALVGVALRNYGSGIRRSLASASLTKTTTPPTLSDAEAIQWVTSNTDTSEVLVCYQDSLYYLYTGRKAARSYLGRANVSPENPEAAISAQSKLVLRVIKENGGRYLIVTKSDYDLPDIHRKSLEALLQTYPQKFVAVFESTDGQARIYRISNCAG